MENIELQYSNNGFLMQGIHNGNYLDRNEISKVVFNALEGENLPPEASSPKLLGNILHNFSEGWLKPIQSILGRKGINFTVKGDSYQYNLRETKMEKETLRMQFLSGVITESEYKVKLEEGAFDNPFAPKTQEPQKGGSLQLKNAAMNVYSYIKKNGFKPVLMIDSKTVGDKMNHDFSVQVLTKAGQGEGKLTISGNVNKTNPQVVEKLQNDIVNNFPFLKISNQSNPSQLVIKLEVDPKANVSESLNEHYIAGGIVGVGAINNPFEGRKKESYEDAFEHFLGQKYALNEEEDVEEGKEVEEPSLYEGELNENVGSSIEKMIDGAKFEFSEKGNDEIIELANYILTPEGAKNIAMSLKNRLKGEGGENYFTNKPEALQSLLDKLK